MKTTVLVGLCVVVCILGCGSGSQLKEVSGKVQLKGADLDYGEIQFHPEDTKTGNMARAEISNGSYKVPADKGLKPGKYRVLISSPEGKIDVKKDEPPGVAPPPPKERIPARFNSESKEYIEVTEAGPNTFDFKIP